MARMSSGVRQATARARPVLAIAIDGFAAGLLDLLGRG